MDAKKSSDTLALFVKQCINTCISIVKVVIRLPYRSAIPAAKTESLIILGNGPSLKHSLAAYPDFFKKHPLLCVNSFSLTKEYTDLKPSYYVILDPGFWKSSEKLVIDTFESVATKTEWPLELLLPLQAKGSEGFASLAKRNANIHITYFNYTVFKGFEKAGHFFYKHNMAMIQSQNVLAAAIFLGINAGFKNMYLFGADHSWHDHLFVNEENVLCVKHVHFYEEEEKMSYVPFYKGLHSKEVFKINEILAIFGKTFYCYVALEKYAKSLNRNVYNASHVSFIDAFKRIKI